MYIFSVTGIARSVNIGQSLHGVKQISDQTNDTQVIQFQCQKLFL